MKLQVTLDTPTIRECRELVELIHEYVDIVEVGNPIIIESGLKLVRELRDEYPDLEICADAKIVNSGHYIASRCLDAGADIVTIMGVTSDQTIAGAVAAAKLSGGKIMADLTGVPDIAIRCLELEDLGVDYLCGHTSFEDANITTNPLSDLNPRVQRVIQLVRGYENNPLRELDLIRSCITGRAKPAIVGRISQNNIAEVVAHEPEIVLVGRAIVGSITPAHAAADLKEYIV